MACNICEVRRPRRHCPGVEGEICAICCGTEREVTVDCPLDCVYLREARLHEKPPEVDVSKVPNRDVKVTDEFVRENIPLMSYLSATIARAAMSVPGTNDFDVREALESLIRTYRTLESGLYYETRPNNPLAANLHQAVQQGVEDLRKEAVEQTGSTTIRDNQVLGVLVFLQRLERHNNNGRRKGRAFLGLLQENFSNEAVLSTPPVPEGGPSLLIP
jgi:hypothetical protein